MRKQYQPVTAEEAHPQFQEMLDEAAFKRSFIVMAAIIDFFGSIPIFVGMKEQNKIAIISQVPRIN